MTMSAHGAMQVLAVGAFVFGTGTTVDVLTRSEEPPPIYLTVAALGYDEDTGIFTQHIVPSTSHAISAEWNTQIVRPVDSVVVPLCAGGSQSINPETGQPWGNGLYDGTQTSMSVDDWVGAECPKLQPGDKAAASWTYQNEYGVFQTVSTTHTISKSPGT